jgi:hypothetical protein
MIETKYKAFSRIKNNKPYILIQGYYTNYEGVVEKIN